MKLSSVILQLRALAPVFNGNVAGAAAYANGVEDQVWLPLPAAYVIPAGSTAGDNESLTGLYQIVPRRFSIVVVIDNSISAADRRGQAAVEQQDAIEAAIFTAILNWRPDWDPADPTKNRASRGIYKVNDELVDFDRARLFYKYDFGLDETITDADGWQLPRDNLIEIEGTITNADPLAIPQGATLATFKTDFPTS